MSNIGKISTQIDMLFISNPWTTYKLFNVLPGCTVWAWLILSPAKPKSK
jgi:hypothetical protein